MDLLVSKLTTNFLENKHFSGKDALSSGWLKEWSQTGVLNEPFIV
jgi:hypothetical protein